MTTIQNRHLRLIHVARRQLGMYEDDYRAHLKTEFGVTSSKALTVDQFNGLMAWFQSLGFTSKPRNGVYIEKGPKSDPSALPTPRQLGMLRGQFDDLNWTEAGRRGLCMRIIKKPWPQTRVEAIKMAEALKNIVARQERKESSQ